MPGKIALSNGCTNSADLCEIDVKFVGSQELKLEGETCKSTKEGYQCGSLLLPQKYLPGSQKATLTLLSKGQEVDKKTISLPATTNLEICYLQEAVANKAVHEAQIIGPRGRPSHFPHIIFALIHAKLFQQAKDMIAQITDPLKNMMLSTELATATKDGNLFDKIIAMVPTLSDREDKFKISEKLVEGLIKTGERALRKKAWEFLESKNSAISYSSYVEFLIELKSPDEALKYVRSLVKSNPTEKDMMDFYLAKIAEAKVGLKLRDEALQLFNEAIELAKQLQPIERKMSLGSIINKLVDAKFDSRALEVMEMLEDSELRKLSFIANQKKDLKLFKKVLQMGEKLKPWEKFRLWQRTSLDMAKAGSFDEAVKLANRIPDIVIGEVTYIELDSKTHKYTGRKVKEENDDVKPTALFDIAVEMVKGNNNIREAIKIEKSIILHDRDRTQRYQHTEFVEALAEAGYFDEALEIADMHGPGGIRDESLIKIASKLAAAKRYDRAIGVAALLLHPKDRAEAFAKIAGEMCPIP